MIISFKELFKEYRVIYEPIPGRTKEDMLWKEMIPGRYGHVYHYGFNGTLGAYVESTKLYGKFDNNPIFKTWVCASDAAIFLFDPKFGFEYTAKILQLKKKRVISESHKLALKKGRESFLLKQTPSN